MVAGAEKPPVSTMHSRAGQALATGVEVNLTMNKTNIIS